MTKYGSQDTEEGVETQDSNPLDLMPQDHPVLEGHNDSSDEYSEETDAHCSLLTYYSGSNRLGTNLQV